MKSKANQIYLKQAKKIQDVMSKKIIFVTTIVGGFNVLSP
jgi:hypothetical protein